MRKNKDSERFLRHVYGSLVPKGLTKLKHEEDPGILLFSSDEKNFVQVQEVNRKKMGGCIKSPKRTIMHRKFPTSLMILMMMAVSSEDDSTPAYVSLQGARVNAVDLQDARVNAVDYTEVLKL